MPDDDIKITPEETPQVSADEVLKYMEEHASEKEQEQVEPPTVPQEEFTDQAPNEEESSSPEHKQTSYYFSSDAAFENTDLDDVDKELFTEVNSKKIEITREDKTMYLKAVLNDTPVILDVPLSGSRISITCRALTTQEKIMVPVACLAYCKTHASYPLAALGTLVQMTRVAMQVTAINKKPFSYVSLHEPLSTLEESTETLVPKVLDTLKDMSSARYNYLLQALNVFEHKLARLADAAFDQDFWDPAGID